MLNIKKLTYQIFLTCLSVLFLGNILFADPTDGCELSSNELFLTSDGDVLYNADQDLGGFQFNVDGATVSGASGGAAASAGFTVSAGGSTVLGFSFSGAVVPAGCGTLTSLALNGIQENVSFLVFFGTDSVARGSLFNKFFTPKTCIENCIWVNYIHPSTIRSPFQGSYSAQLLQSCF